MESEFSIVRILFFTSPDNIMFRSSSVNEE